MTTDLVAVGLRSQLLVQRSHLGCQMLESIPEFTLLVMKRKSPDRVNAGRTTTSRSQECWGHVTYATSSGRSPCSLNLRGVLLRAYLQPLKYMLQEQPKEKDAPHVSGSLP